MSSKSLRLLVPLALAAMPLSAQVHEAERPVDLSRGLVLSQDMKRGIEGFSGPPALKTNVGQKSFALSLLMNFPPELKQTIIASQWHDAQGWRFLVTADGALRFEGRTEGKKDPILLSTARGVIAPDTSHHLVLNVLRDATKPNAGIWVDGVEIASGVVPPVDLNPLLQFLHEPDLLGMNVACSHLRIYHRDLSRPEILALHLEATTLDGPAAKHPDPPVNGPRFVPQQDETIALIGGTEAVALAESGELEAMLLMAFPETRFHFRNLAWEGDTVFRQDRPLNFGSLEQQLKRVNAGSVFVMFGRQECLEGGSDGLAEFREAFGKLLDTVEEVTPNIVVIGPWWYERKPPPAPSLEAAEAAHSALSEVLEVLCETRQCRYLNFFELNIHPSVPMTSDGVNLTPYGLQLMAQGITLELGYSLPDMRGPQFARVKTAIQTKNRLWHHYWRPSNWAFLHGDRTQQPSSRDPVNPQLRFFPAEQEKYLPLIKDAEEKVFKLVEEATKKLP